MPRLRAQPEPIRGARALAAAGFVCDLDTPAATARSRERLHVTRAGDGASTGNKWKINFQNAPDMMLGKYRYNFGPSRRPLYREIPGFIVNRSYGYLENRKRGQISDLDFLQKLILEFPRCSPSISGDFLTRPLPASESSLGTPLPQGSKSYGFIEHDGEPTPSRGPTRARLQGNHYVDFRRAGRRDQPLRQGQPGFFASRRRHGGLGSPLHAQTGKAVM